MEGKRPLFRQLTPLEMAEGALLADLGLILQLMQLYIPVGGTFFRLLVPCVFAVLVLRRNLYTGSVALAVAVLIGSIMTGPGFFVSMLLSGGAGLYLGLAMKYRLNHLLTLLLGTTAGAFALYALTFFFSFLFALPLEDLVQSLKRSYEAARALTLLLAGRIGQGDLWEKQLLPLVDPLAQFALAYWWLSLYFLYWLTVLPLVVFLYFLTNLLVRQLGFDVRPFPEGRLAIWLQWVTHLIRRVGGRRNRKGV